MPQWREGRGVWRAFALPDAPIADTDQRSRGVMRPGVCFYPPPEEGVGNAGCPPHPRSRVHFVLVERTRVTTSTPESPDVPARNGFTTYFALSPVIGLSCHRHPADMVCPRPVGPTSPPLDLTPASRRQDHTTSPYAATSLVRSLLIAHRPFANPPCNPVARKTLPRPPHPSPRP